MPGATGLESLQRHSVVLSDRNYTEHARVQAGSVSSEVLSSTLLNPSAPAGLKACVKNAFEFKACHVDYRDMAAFACQIDKALVNLTAAMMQGVDGKITVEVDPRLASDAPRLIRRVELLAAQLEEAGVPKAKVLFRLPATYEGIAATATLEKQGYQCILIFVFSYAQAQLAVEAGASVIKLSLGALQDFQREFPNVIRDPTGPREDSGCRSPVDPGRRMIENVYYMTKAANAKVRDGNTASSSRYGSL